MEETLWDGDHPFVFWAMLCIPIPEKLADPMATMFGHLESFITNMVEADMHFTVFPHKLSKYENTDDLLEPIEDPDMLPDNINKWLQYFPQACPRARGEYMYTSVLLRFWEPFPKVVKTMAMWLRKTKFGIWKSSLQSKKLVALGWLLFSTSTMDEEVLHGEISLCI